jgi:ribose transport system ATP-binding protein
MSSSEGEQSRSEPVVRLKSISKEFPGVLAVDGVDLDILSGEVHVVAGENGAGKSTLLRYGAGAGRDRGSRHRGGEPLRGQGTVVGTLIGAFLIALIRNGAVLLDVNTFYQQVIIGVVI